MRCDATQCNAMYACMFVVVCMLGHVCHGMHPMACMQWHVSYDMYVMVCMLCDICYSLYVMAYGIMVWYGMVWQVMLCSVMLFDIVLWDVILCICTSHNDQSVSSPVWCCSILPLLNTQCFVVRRLVVPAGFLWITANHWQNNSTEYATLMIKLEAVYAHAVLCSALNLGPFSEQGLLWGSRLLEIYTWEGWTCISLSL